jgi:cytochrome P460
MNTTLRTAAAAAGFALAISVVPAGAKTDCDPGKPGAELSTDEAQAVYDCIKDALFAGYQKGDKKWIPAEYVSDYRDWAKVSTIPVNPGWHGERYLLTYVNEVGAEEYLKYLEERGPMPVGTVIAKESFAVKDSGKVKKAPLFIMEKVAAGTMPDTADWLYLLVSPGGKPMKINAQKACSVCHQDNFGFRDGLGYPVEEARVTQ